MAKQVVRVYYAQDRNHQNPNKVNYSIDFNGCHGFNQYGEASSILIENGFTYRSSYQTGGRGVEVWDRELAPAHNPANCYDLWCTKCAVEAA